jgi:PAS domain S-box-containing protein
MNGEQESTDATNAPHLIEGKFAFVDLVDLGRLQELLEKFSKATGFTTGLLSHPDLKLLVKTGWRDVCTEFHRANPESFQHCLASNKYLLNDLGTRREPNLKLCKNGLVDGAVPILVRGKHIASLATGQAFFSPPDMERFARQAEQFGFNRDAYLKAVKEVPVVTEEQFRTALSFLVEMAQLIAEQALNNLETREVTRALAVERELLSVTLRSIGDAVITTDREGRISFMNRVAEDMCGWTQNEAVGHLLMEIFDIKDEKSGARCEDPVVKILATGGIVGLASHAALISRDGTRRVIEDSGAPIRDRESRIIGAVIVFRDVTEKRRMQEEMLRANRLDSLGILAGGIAHDFNNILTIIMGNTSLAMLSVSPGEKNHRQLVEMEKACFRAKDLTDQLLTFSKGGAPVKKAVSLENLIRESVDFALRGSTIKCRYEIAQDLWPVEADNAQISRVFNNLAINSVQAMPDGGDFTVRAGNVELKPNSGLPLRAGRYVRLSFEDRGIGIPLEHLTKVFDPFFTTKQRGSGLGLSVCHSVVARHEGHVSVESELGRGTTFHVFLPASNEVPTATFPEEKVAPVSFHGRVLVMDDEDSIREMAKTMLVNLGCEVECVADGAEAVARYQQARAKGRPFDALIMDLTIPGGLGGKEAARQVLAVNPGAKIVASSGYSTDPVMAAPKSHGFRATIAKPYTVTEMVRVLKSVLGG